MLCCLVCLDNVSGLKDLLGRSRFARPEPFGSSPDWVFAATRQCFNFLLSQWVGRRVCVSFSQKHTHHQQTRLSSGQWQHLSRSPGESVHDQSSRVVFTLQRSTAATVGFATLTMLPMSKMHVRFLEMVSPSLMFEQFNV